MSLIAALFKTSTSTDKKKEAAKSNDLKDSGALKPVKSKPKVKDAENSYTKDLEDTGKRKRSVVEGSSEDVTVTRSQTQKPVSVVTKPVADDKKAVAKPISEERELKRQKS
jgi:hypothetical protein